MPNPLPHPRLTWGGSVLAVTSLCSPRPLSPKCSPQKRNLGCVGRREAQGTGKVQSRVLLAPAGGQVKTRREHADGILLSWGRISAMLAGTGSAAHCCQQNPLWELHSDSSSRASRDREEAKGGQIFCGHGKAATPSPRISVTVPVMAGAGPRKTMTWSPIWEGLFLLSFPPWV